MKSPPDGQSILILTGTVKMLVPGVAAGLAVIISQGEREEPAKVKEE